MTVVVGVDGAGRTHRLRALAPPGAVWITPDHPGVPTAAAPEGRSSLPTDSPGIGSALVVDDPHRLDDATLRAVSDVARGGVPVLLGRRPTLDRPALADLDEAAARTGVVQLDPLDAAAVAALTGRADLHEASAGWPAIATLLATGGLLPRVQRRLATVPPAVAEVARVVALGLDLDDDVLATAAGQPADVVPGALRELRDLGFLVPATERLVPAVAAALLDDLAPAERRRVHARVAAALAASGADPVAAATQLRAARIRTGADVFRAAGDRLRFTDPAAAIGWYADAVDAGADPALVAAGQAEAAALVGLPADPAPAGDPDTAHRLALVAGAVATHDGRAARAADVLAAAAPPGPLLAVPALVALGRAAAARELLAGPAEGKPLTRPAEGVDLAAADVVGTSAGSFVGAGVASGPARPFWLLAEAVLAAGAEPATAVPLLIEAAEAAERVPPAVVLPDTPHAWGAVVAVTAGDAATAEHLLGRALDRGVGGPVGAQRHRLLLAWVRMRTGRYDTAVAELRRTGAGLPGREVLLAAALRAGLARRSGDIATLRAAWSGVEPVLARQAVDLFQAEQVEELAVAAIRLRRPGRIAPVLAALDAAVAGLGHPPAWTVTVAWLRLQLGVAADDPAAVAAAADALAAAGPVRGRQRAQAVAAEVWTRSMGGDVDAASVVTAVEGLAAAELPWEASRLAGHAAIRTADPAAARRLLEVARELSGVEQERAAGESNAAGLSEREVEVARLVLDGRTHKEIGAQLYISPKTVEHHVARIRVKVGATDRAEFVAALKSLLNS
ncbi:LuxR C-terminal-related transcriptional regulator [Asanoa siamensis]|uniref:Helix-turn-helix transcriptional regulator n=1 Tax=Asanoa siamensis TaxID=926357 RepID=A0ABQ4CGZ5_9ACTN|nr:LuxR C-terminal-related transcriptional regulator [Asanoa siamensis]GIF70565.1 helix-turn-helix transcriptional regulator [Asanoa siamensis]